MTVRQSIGRRTFLRGAGGIVITSVVAGCTSGSSSSAGNEPSSVDEWLSETKNYDGTTPDWTGTKTVTVEVGPKQNEYVFVPAAIEVSPGTTVTWEWIGEGTHNVVGSGEQFKSGPPESGAIFEHTFETAGTFYYYCDPHRSMGMKGVIIVTDSETEGGTSNGSDA
jgi:halocyanin-like protein